MKKLFTLTDLIVTILILSILAAIVLLNINNLNEKAKITSLNADQKNIQLATDKYNLDKGYCPSKVQPKLGKPQPIDFDLLYSDYIKSMPQHKDAYYWVDFECVVYISLIDAPTDVSVDVPSGKITWTPHKDSSNSIIYVKRPKGSIKLVDEDRTGNYDGEDGKDHLVAEEDKYGLDTPPVGEDYNGYPKTSDEDDTPKGPIVACDTNGFICIYTAEELASIGVDSDFPLNGNYRLANNIDLIGYSNWKPIFNEEDWIIYSGVFDGNGFAINNLSISDEDQYHVGLFARSENAHFMNITLNNVNINASSNAGAIVSNAEESVFENISVNGRIQGDSYTGGIIAQGYYLSMRNISFNGEVISTDGNAAGIVSHANDLQALNLKYNGTISARSYAGGIFGNANSVNAANLTVQANLTTTGNTIGGLVGYTSRSHFTNAHFKGNVTGSHYVGGLVGNASDLKLHFVSAEGNINGKLFENATPNYFGNSYFGGLFGYAYDAEVVKAIYKGDVRVEIEGAEYVGGVVGSLSGSEFTDVSVTSNIEAPSRYVGGISGYTDTSDFKYIDYKGVIKANGQSVGGITGYSSYLNVSDSSFDGELINNHEYTGGLAGQYAGGLYERVYSNISVNSTAIENVNALFGHAKLYDDFETKFKELYWNSELSSQPHSSKYVIQETLEEGISDSINPVTGQHRSLEEMKDINSYSNWDFSTIWEFIDNKPVLRKNIVEIDLQNIEEEIWSNN